MAYLDSRGVRKGILTRNFDMPVNHLLGKYLPDTVFEPIITREFKPPKPDPAGILHIARSWGLVRQSIGDPGVPVEHEEEHVLTPAGDGLRQTDRGKRSLMLAR